jgi:4-amino-4-deoxy-L-arabinose transferase-like glycosyltransferase
MPSETASAARWRSAFWTVWAILLIVKVALAAALAPFGDEAWYWQESRALDWSFSDLPVATAALIRLGESVLGHGTFGMRAPFLLIGALLPLVLVRTAARLFGTRAGWQTGLLASGLPLLATLGLFALPDAPLTLCAALAFDALERAVTDGRRRDWIVLGLALAGAWLSHYRAAMLLLAGLAFLLFSARGRACASRSGLWLAVAISIGGLLPLLAFNAQHDWVALGFQLVERNPWSFHADGLLQPIEQAIVCTPLFYAFLWWALWACARRAAAAPWDLLATAAAVPIVGYFVLGCFADDTRLRLHWPLPGYLPLLVALPALLHEASRTLPAWRAFVGTTMALLCAGTLATFGYFVLAAVPGGAAALAGVKAFPEHWVGWNEVAARTRELLEQPAQRDAILVADNFMLAAELDFALGATRPVYTLDHPINAKHGRVPQLRLWQRDETALRAAGARPLLLVVEPTARRERERAAWLAQVCARTAAPRVLERLDLYAGRKRYRFLHADGIQPAAGAVAGADCIENAR